MALVIGAFTTLGEAERAAAALLEGGFHADAVTAVARSGGGRMLLAQRIPVARAGDPARLITRAERAGASASAGGAIGVVLSVAAAVVLHLAGVVSPLVGLAAAWLPWLGASGPLVLAGIIGALLGGGLGALVRREHGLPHELAFRFGLRLDQGDTVIAVVAPTTGEARAAQETLALNGAILAHVTRGTLEGVGDPPPPATLAPRAPGEN